MARSSSPEPPMPIVIYCDFVAEGQGYTNMEVGKAEGSQVVRERHEAISYLECPYPLYHKTHRPFQSVSIRFLFSVAQAIYIIYY